MSVPSNCASAIGQLVPRLQIQVIGRLVEQEQVRLLPDDQRKREPRLFAAGEGRDLRRRHFAGKIEAAEEVAQFLFARVGRETRGCCNGGVSSGAQRFELMLREIADAQRLAFAHLPAERRKRAGQRLDQR